ncbi:MAG: adenylate kinase [Limnochordia bacterium]|jgi:adenylate kinase
MRLVMLGLPAAGKGTHGRLLAQTFSIPHISTGSMFRAAMQLNNDLGRRARWYIDRGELVPDGVAAEIVKERLSQEDCRHGFILDGFPRTVPQAEDLDAALASMHMAIDAAINIQISEAEAIRRIANRKVCSQCGSTGDPGSEVCKECGGPLIQRPDDTPEIARHRLEVYMVQTQPVVDYYREQGRLVPVNGLQPIDRVFMQICQRLARMGIIKTSKPCDAITHEVDK